MAVLVPQEDPRQWQVDEVTVTDPGVIKKAIAAAAIGNITEWYDFGVYAYFATTIETVFFAGLPESQRQIATFGTFAVAFLIRPFGGMYFGPLADRIGRTKVLAITMIMMALGTFAIGLIPSQNSIGFAAPILLLLCRLIQGFSTGGEYGNAMTFIAEYAPDRRRGFLGSWLEFGTFTGYLMGAVMVTVVSALTTEAQLDSWAWRIPFFLALPLGLVGLYLRSRLADTPAFAAMEKESEDREKENRAAQEAGELARLWPFVLVCSGLVIVWNVTNYMLTAYVPTYLTDTLPSDARQSDTVSQVLQIVVIVVALLSIPFVGMLSDRIGRKPIAWAGSIGLIVLGVPMILLIRQGTFVSQLIGLLVMGLLLVLFSATMPSTLPSLFPTKVRGAGLSISFNISVSIFAGTTATVVSALVSATGDLNWPGYYLVAAGIVGAIAVSFLLEPNGMKMWGSPPAAVDDSEAKDFTEASTAEFAAIKDNG